MARVVVLAMMAVLALSAATGAQAAPVMDLAPVGAMIGTAQQAAQQGFTTLQIVSIVVAAVLGLFFLFMFFRTGNMRR